MKYIIRTTDKNYYPVDYWIIDAHKEKKALQLANNDSRTTSAFNWSISPINNEFDPTGGGWKKPK